MSPKTKQLRAIQTRWVTLPPTLHAKILADIQRGYFKNLSDAVITILRSQPLVASEEILALYPKMKDWVEKTTIDFPQIMSDQIDAYCVQNKETIAYLNEVICTAVHGYYTS